MNNFEYKIQTTWDDRRIDHDPVSLKFESIDDESLIIKIDAPFFGDPEQPKQRAGEFFNLWDYEVAEAFFLNEEGKYLELEFGPYNHFLVILLDGVRQVFKQDLQIEYKAQINGNRWTGIGKIPESLFPRMTTKMNAYAIHGSNVSRVYESLYPTPFGKYQNPDFHRLDYFQPIDFKSLLPLNWNRSNSSDYWN
ncbi:unnamed protein product [Brachionus calyciflorus]|uniref:Uncharacterized protein n=1 Tax=Brachionus calyciflorus TaxID=104777 RepID=A0A814AFN8_9BILA|nr:unnamed protein product [Brachionus calyciflorus]